MQERGNDQWRQPPYDAEDGGWGRSGYDGWDQQARPDSGPAYRSRPPEPHRRTGLIAVAIVAVGALGVGTAYGLGLFDDKKPASSAATTPTSASTTIASQPTPARAQSPTPASPSDSASPKPAALMMPSTAEQSVGQFYGDADFMLVPDGVQQPPSDPVNQFLSPTVAGKYWDSKAHKPTAAAMCGAQKPNVAIIIGVGTPFTVTFFEKGQMAPQQAQITVNPAGKISAITCATATSPSDPGAKQLGQYYGVDLYSSALTTAHLPKYSPGPADGPRPWLDFDLDTCSQYRPETWVFYPTSATAGGVAWSFTYDGNTYLQQVFTDPSTGHIERTLCDGFPPIPAPNKAVAGKPGPNNAPDPASAMLQKMLQAYIYERSQVSLGAAPTDELAPYFTSAADYANALKATGPFPFLCSSKAPNGAEPTGTKVSGSTEVVSVTAGFTEGPPDHPATPVGKESVAVDLTTMKIKSITCQ